MKQINAVDGEQAAGISDKKQMIELDAENIVEDLKGMVVIPAALPELPETFNYPSAVEETKQQISSAKKVTGELLRLLYVNREKLRHQGARKKGETWETFCRDIGISKRKANRWLARYFPASGTSDPKLDTKSEVEQGRAIEERGADDDEVLNQEPKKHHQFTLQVFIAADGIEPGNIPLTEGARNKIAVAIAKDVRAEGIEVNEIVIGEWIADAPMENSKPDPADAPIGVEQVGVGPAEGDSGSSQEGAEPAVVPLPDSIREPEKGIDICGAEGCSKPLNGGRGHCGDHY